MGTCKDNMQATTPKTQGIFERLKAKKAKAPVKSDADLAKTFVDYICLADDKIEELILSKEKDLANEKGQEKDNKKKLRLLEQMQQHHGMIVELAQEYTELS